MLKKLLYSFLIICSISCIAFAEDLPAYVIENSDYELWGISTETETLNYSFYEADNEFSNFIIQLNESDITIEVVSESSEHKLKLEVIDTESLESVYSKALSLTKNNAVTQILGKDILKKNKYYYIKLSEPTTKSAVGYCKVSGAKALLPNKPNLHITEDIKALQELNILEKQGFGSIRGYQEVTRAEFAKIIVSALKITDLDNAPKFSDVFSEHPAYYYIGTVQNLGIMIGYSDGTFSPDSPISHHEMIKAIVCMLGYKPLADSLGGYYEGYIRTASKINLTKSTLITEDYRTAGVEVAAYINNSLSIPLMKQTGNGEQAEYIIFNGVNTELITLKSLYE